MIDVQGGYPHGTAYELTVNAWPALASLPPPADKDGDGISDKEDGCPDEKGLAEFKGCPDRDGDKVGDKEDACPDIPGVVALKGCPDRDGDGVEDKADVCPDKPGVASNKGCPELKLSVLDASGNVVNSATRSADGNYTFDGVTFDENMVLRLEGERTEAIQDVTVVIGGETKKANRIGAEQPARFGFPKTPKVETQEVAVKLDQKEAEVLKKAFNNLEFATAKDIIKESSFASLDELAGLMAKKPTWKLKISGHTDNKGEVVTNLKLSEKRAEAVKKYLMGKGIAADRFKVEWFGSSKPVADNATEAGRQQNRRVEMLIFE